MLKRNPAIEAISRAIDRCIVEGSPLFVSQPAKYIIKDWVGNTCFHGKEFDSFDDAWEFLHSKYERLSDRAFDEQMSEYSVVVANE